MYNNVETFKILKNLSSQTNHITRCIGFL